MNKSPGSCHLVVGSCVFVFCVVVVLATIGTCRKSTLVKAKRLTLLINITKLASKDNNIYLDDKILITLRFYRCFDLLVNARMGHATSLQKVSKNLG